MSEYLFDQKPSLEDLQHYGVRGMKWGVRKKRTKKKRTLAQKQARAQKVGKGIAIGIAGLQVAGMILAGVGAKQMSDVPPWADGDFTGNNNRSSGYRPPSANRSTRTSPADIINKERDTQMSSLRRMFEEGRMDADQFNNFSQTLNNRYDRRVADAESGG